MGCRIQVIDSQSNPDPSQHIHTQPSTPIDEDLPIYLPNTHKWDTIIIHHSGTEVGNMAIFDRAHKQRGWKGVGYHFVIDNGSSGREMGQIEVTFRWQQQLNGAHCHASNMNSHAIGICLVGNFDKHGVPSEQFESLVKLVRLLQRTYSIPKTRVIGHGYVNGANTHCPGLLFPWDTFYSLIYD